MFTDTVPLDYDAVYPSGTAKCSRGVRHFMFQWGLINFVGRVE